MRSPRSTVLTHDQTAGISLEELGAKFGDEVAIDFEHALEAKTLKQQDHGQDLKGHHIQSENIGVAKERK